MYGHEIWIGSVERKDGKITFSGDYGHHMNHDRVFPDDYSLIKIIDGKGNEINDYTVRCDGSARFVTFDNPGDEIITVYFFPNPYPGLSMRKDGTMTPRRTSRMSNSPVDST